MKRPQRPSALGWRIRTRGSARWLWTFGLLLAVRPAFGADPTPDEFFEKTVRPILVERCAECHGAAGKVKGGLRLVSRASILKGGDSGPAAVPGKPAESLLVEAIRYVDEPKMPPSGKLNASEIAALTRWVELGMPWPETGTTPTTSPVPVPASRTFAITEEQRRFWSFQPVKAAPPPPVRDASWPRSDIDRYILAALEAKGLRPSGPADRRAYIRRATYDLTGLPPQPEEVEAFVADPRPDAFEILIDRLLASPRYGERWGRHWLDLVRYTDSFDARIAGSNNVMDINDSWRYRDWVVNALNRDLPYDQFLTAQIAGDVASEGFDRDGIVATGFLAIGNWGGGDADKEKLLTDIADDQVDAVSRAFLGLTLACARCHDHKFDPISTRDYYGLAGIFFSTHILPDVGPKTNGPPMLRIPLESPTERDARASHARRIADLEKELAATLDRARAEVARARKPEAARHILAAWRANGPEDPGLLAFAVRRWAVALGLRDDLTLLDRPLRSVHGRPGVFGWRGTDDTPSLLVNTNPDAAALLTFKVPGRSVTVHPGPTTGIVVEWSSPIDGRVDVSGMLADMDPAGGDGVSWGLDHVAPGKTERLASGQFDNGGRGAFGEPTPLAVVVREGAALRLTVRPRASHTCDTTHLVLTVRSRDGKDRWDLARDLVDDPIAANPHPDRLGHAEVWRFGVEGDRPGSIATDPAGKRALEQLGDVIRDPASTRAQVEAAAVAFAATFDRVDANSPFWPRTRADESSFSAPDRQSLARIREELDRLGKNPPPPLVFANGAQEGGVPGSPHAGVHDVKVHVRGMYSRLGDLVPRRFPVVLAGETQPPITRGSGRLDLARWLARPDHPLTARVMANRVWQHHFGAGVVRTPSNFGALGERPSHPELLDHLARLLTGGGWSLKRLHRSIMLSSTYRQSCEADPATFAADPDNRLFGRMNRRRLDAESVRDSLLAVSGNLDLAAGGPAVRDPNLPRRTLYLMTIRSDRASFGSLFDAADPTAMVDARVVSTVAPQALYLLNNGFVLDQARALSARLRAEAPADRDARIERAYAVLFGRPPTPDERAVGRECVDRFAAGSAAANPPDPDPDAGWDAYIHVLICTNEWMYID